MAHLVAGAGSVDWPVAAGKRADSLHPRPGCPGLSFERSLIINLPWWSTWAALTPLIVWLASRIQLTG